MRPFGHHLALALLAAAVAGAPPIARDAGAQGAGSRPAAAQSLVVGSVDDSTGLPIRDVQIEVVGSRVRAVSNEQGRFRIAGLAPGVHTFRTRRLGFEPLQFEVEVRARDTTVVAVELFAAVTDLAAVVVTAEETSARLAQVGFDQRRLYAGVPPSQFVTRAEIEKRNPVVLSQMLRTMSARAQVCANGLVFVDGVRLGTLVDGDEVSRDTMSSSSRFGPLTRSSVVGMSHDPSPPARAKEQIDLIPPVQVAGMEVYVGAAQIPPQFKTAGRANATAACVILIWTS